MTQAREAIKYLLRKTFDIREGELLRAFFMQANIFLLISTLLIVKPTVNALFLSRFGAENLPGAFILVAIVAAVISSLYSRVLRKYSLNKIINGTLIFSIGVLVFFGILLRLNVTVGWVLYTFYVWVAIFAVLSASQFWIFANLVFNAREAKRLFGFIGAGAIAGGIFGGYLTSLLAPLIGSENLLFVSAFLLMICIPLTRHVWDTFIKVTKTSFTQERKTQGFSDHPFQLIRKSRHLTYLAGIIGVSVIVAKLVDYQFSDIAASYISDPDELAAFFGFWFSNLNVISLLVQLFLTRRVVGTFGVGTSLFFLPGGILLGSVILLFLPALWAAVLIKISDGSLKQSINKAATELLALPIPPEIKNQAKTFIDVFVDSIATGIGGLILIFMVNGIELSSRYISLMTVGLIGLWVYLANQVRQEYIRSFKLKINQEKSDTTKRGPDFSHESVLGGLMRVLEKGNERQILYVLRKIREINDDRLFASIKPLLHHSSGEVRAEAIRNLYFFKNRHVTDEILPFIHDPDQRVKIAAFEYLIEHRPEDIEELMRAYITDEDYRVRGAALVSLANETRDNATLRKAFDLEELVQIRLNSLAGGGDPEEISFRKIQILKAIGQGNIPSYYDRIEKFLYDADPAVVKQAIISAADTNHPRFLPLIVPFIGLDSFADAAKSALVRFGPGVVDVLVSLAKQPETHVEMIRAMPSVVAQIGNQKSVNFLFQLLDYEDLMVRIESLKALNSLKIAFPHLNFHEKMILHKISEEVHLFQDTLSVLYVQSNKKIKKPSGRKDLQPEINEARKSLKILLERRLDGSLERIFRLLGLKYPPEDMLNIYRGLQSKQEDLRVNAVEFLDNLLTAPLKKLLIPVVETALLDTISDKTIEQLNLSVPNEYRCFQLLLEGKDTRLKLAVLHLIGLLKDVSYLSLVENLTSSPNPKIQNFATKTLERLREGK
ncbi:MAG: Npt1/Npt2 family nucleotide transporter [Bacteroidia bacterium]|nr:Npt1/Npt2 family nucleotide transporter [Bacteroidia bacterium]